MYLREFDCWPYLQHLPLFQVRINALMMVHSVPGVFLTLTGMKGL